MAEWRASAADESRSRLVPEPPTRPGGMRLLMASPLRPLITYSRVLDYEGDDRVACGRILCPAAVFSNHTDVLIRR